MYDECSVGGRATRSSASRQYCACQYTISYVEHQDNGVLQRTEVFPSCSRTLYNRDLIQPRFRVCVNKEIYVPICKVYVYPIHAFHFHLRAQSLSKDSVLY